MHRPYPYESLPKLSRVQVRAMSRLHSLFSDTDFAEARHAAELLIGLPLSCSVGLPAACSGYDIAAREAVWIELIRIDAATPGTSVWLELPFRFCELLIERTLGADGSLGIAPAGPKVEELRLGALAYLAARVCAAAGPRFRLQMLHAGTPPLTDATLVRLAVQIEMVSAHEAANAHFYVPTAALDDLHSVRPSRRVLPQLGLTLWADAGFTPLDLATLRSLHAGDVIVLQQTGLWRERVDAEFQGAVDVRVLGSGTALRCRLLEGGRLEVETIACTAERSMTSGRRITDPSPDAPSQGELTTQTLPRPDGAALARDAPIEVALEIARFQLRLSELEQVRPGDVLVTGSRIGERVTLRAANRAFAEGELVDVEGELGVRITRLLVD